MTVARLCSRSPRTNRNEGDVCKNLVQIVLSDVTLLEKKKKNSYDDSPTGFSAGGSVRLHNQCLERGRSELMLLSSSRSHNVLGE